MRFPRKLVMAAAAVALPVSGIAVLVAPGIASAGGSPVTGTGTVTCTGVKGTITFSPPLVPGGTGTSTTTIKVTLTKCTTGGGSNITKVTKGTVTSTSSGSNDCTGSLTTSKPESLTTTWKSTPSAVPTSTSFSGFNLNTSPEGFTLPNTGGTASGTGSFGGTDSGASSTATVDIKGLTTKSCALGGTQSLSKLTISGGSSFSG